MNKPKVKLSYNTTTKTLIKKVMTALIKVGRKKEAEQFQEFSNYRDQGDLGKLQVTQLAGRYVEFVE